MYAETLKIGSRNILYPINSDIMKVYKFNFIDKDDIKPINESSHGNYEKTINNTLKTELLDIDRFIKMNPSTKEITNPVFFSGNNSPTDDGLLSNTIFGISKFSRSNIYGYIDLVEYFIHPVCYKVLLKLDTKFNSIIHSTSKYMIDKDGYLIEDPNGNTGIKWLKDNFEKLSFYKSDSGRRRDIKVDFLLRNYKKNRMFINKYLVIPPFYRDINNTGKNVGVGQINKLYSSLILAARSLRENNDYGLSMADSTCARIQDTLRAIYDYFCGNNNPMIKDQGTGLSGKTGIIKRSNLSKTTDYGSRLVMTAPELKVERVTDLMVDLDTSACPLAAVATNYFPFVMFHMRKFFENSFLNVSRYTALGIDNNPVEVYLKNPLIYFSDDFLKKQLKQFIYSYDTRFTPVEAPIDYESMPPSFKNRKFYLQFNPKKSNSSNQLEPAYNRKLTWTDVIFICAHEAVKDKIMSFTRYPIDQYFNTTYTKIEISTTNQTEELYVNDKLYKFYPKIREEDIGSRTKNKFIDTMQVCNLYLSGMSADYDGDTGNANGSYVKETNEQLKEYINSNANFIGLGVTNLRCSEKEAIQAAYDLTKVLNQDKSFLTEPLF